MREIPPASQPFVELPDGRRLTYSSVGPDHGSPVLYMHGAIGSPVRRSVPLEQLTTELGVRYLMVNRPGFAGSDLPPDRTIRSFAPDLAELADPPGLARFPIVGGPAGR